MAESNEHPDVKKWRDRFTWLLIANVAVVVTLLIVGGVIFDKYYKNALIPKNFAQVDNEGLLYRSGMLDHRIVEQTLRDNDIDVVLSMTATSSKNPTEDRDIQAEVETADRLGIEHQFWPLGGDGTGELEHYIGAIKRMKAAHDAGQSVLVHCAAGSYRTGGMYAIWRLYIDGWSPQRVRDEMGYYGMGDDNILVEYLNTNMPTIAQRLVEEGIIDQAPDPLPMIPN